MTKFNSLVELPRFETVNDAIAENSVRIDALQEVGGRENEQLAERLIDCNEGIKRCNSLACKYCNRIFRVKRVDSIVAKIRRSDTRWWTFTIIDYSRAFPHEELHHYDIKKSKERMRKLFDNSNFGGPVIGSFEVDFHSRCKLWLPHYHLLAPKSQLNQLAKPVLQEKIRLLQPNHIKDGIKPIPSQFKDLNSLYTQVSYAYKFVCYRRYDYISTIKGKKRPGRGRLELKIFCDSLRWLDKHRRGEMMFSYGERGW